MSLRLRCLCVDSATVGFSLHRNTVSTMRQIDDTGPAELVDDAVSAAVDRRVLRLTATGGLEPHRAPR